MRIMRTILPWLRKPERQKPAIRLEASSFCVTEGDKVILQVEWARVREVVAFKEDLFGYDEIRLGFRTGGSDTYQRVTEKFVHYQELLQELPRRLPGIRTDWFSDVAFPAFVPNWTTLWGQALRQQS